MESVVLDLSKLRTQTQQVKDLATDRRTELDHSLVKRRMLQRRANYGWQLNGRDEQKPPPGDWRTWLLMGGRGSGKTRAGAEWVHAMASGAKAPLRIALVAETLADVR